MAKAYWVATYRSISDPEALAGYAKLGGPAIMAAGMRGGCILHRDVFLASRLAECGREMRCRQGVCPQDTGASNGREQRARSGAIAAGAWLARVSVRLFWQEIYRRPHPNPSRHYRKPQALG